MDCYDIHKSAVLVWFVTTCIHLQTFVIFSFGGMGVCFGAAPCWNGQIDCVRMLSLEIDNSVGVTPFHTATREHSTQKKKFLQVYIVVCWMRSRLHVLRLRRF